MQSVEAYMDAAKAAHGIRSDRELGRRVGVGPTAPTNWRTKKAWPADATMLRLADLAGIDPAEALMDLNKWRADSPTVKSVYERIAHRLAGAIAALAIIGGVGYGTAGPADARVGDAGGMSKYTLCDFR